MDPIYNPDQPMMDDDDDDGLAEGFAAASIDPKIDDEEGGAHNDSDIDDVKDILNKVSINGTDETGIQDQTQTEDQAEEPKTTADTEQAESKIENAEGGQASGTDLGDVKDILTYQQMRKLFLRPSDSTFKPDTIYASEPPEISDILEDDFYAFAGPVMQEQLETNESFQELLNFKFDLYYLFTESATPPSLYN